MRKITAALCAALMLGLCACGKEAAPAQDTTATTVATTTADTTAPHKAYLNLKEASPFSDGVALVRYTDAEGAEKAAAINSAGDILFDLPEGMPLDARYKNGICVVGDVIYDKTGAVIASPDKSGYDALITNDCGGYVLAKKLSPLPAGETKATAATTTTTAAATSTTLVDTTTTTVDTTQPTDTTPTMPLIPTGMELSIGVLNNKGEWEHPLSTDHPIAKALSSAAHPEEHFTLIAEGVLQVHADLTAQPQFYHFADNKMTSDYAHYESMEYQDEDSGIYKVMADGTKELVIANVVVVYPFQDAFIGRSIVEGEEGEEPQTLIKLYDYKGKALADLTAYPTTEKYYYVTERLLITVDDGSGNRQLALLQKDGTPIMDPVALNLRDTVYPPDETGFVIAGYTADGVVSYRHYDYAGNVSIYTDVTAFNGFSEGLAAVTLSDGRLVYINQMAEIVIQ